MARTSGMKIAFFFMIAGVFLGTARVAMAEEPEASATSPEKKSSTVKKNPQRGKPLREKETEGTEAADRFEADTVIKSKYRLNGESLEVDPD